MELEEKQVDLTNGWVAWQSLASLMGQRGSTEGVERPRDEGGGYIISVDGQKIHRVNGIDTLGILDIGQSKYLKSRISKFYRCIELNDINSTACGHMAGWRYCWLGYHELFPVEHLLVTWRYEKDPVDLEGEMMRRYVELFKELPPLNYSFNWKK